MASIVASLRSGQYNEALTTGLRLNAVVVQVGAAVWSVFGLVWTIAAVLFRSRISRALDRPLVTFPFPEDRVVGRRAKRHAIRRAAEPLLVPLAWFAGSFGLVGGSVIGVLGPSLQGAPPMFLQGIVNGAFFLTIFMMLLAGLMLPFSFKRGLKEYELAQREAILSLPGALGQLAGRIISAQDKLVADVTELEKQMHDASEVVGQVGVCGDADDTVGMISQEIRAALGEFAESTDRKNARAAKVAVRWTIWTAVAGVLLGAIVSFILQIDG